MSRELYQLNFQKKNGVANYLFNDVNIYPEPLVQPVKSSRKLTCGTKKKLLIKDLVARAVLSACNRGPRSPLPAITVHREATFPRKKVCALNGASNLATAPKGLVLTTPPSATQ